MTIGSSASATFGRRIIPEASKFTCHGEFSEHGGDFTSALNTPKLPETPSTRKDAGNVEELGELRNMPCGWSSHQHADTE